MDCLPDILERLGVLDLGNTVVCSIPIHPLDDITNYWFNSGYHSFQENWFLL